MTKDELVEVLKPFVGDTEITVGGCFPQVLYHPAAYGFPASLNLEDEHYQPDNNGEDAPIQIYPYLPVPVKVVDDNVIVDLPASLPPGKYTFKVEKE
jgi:hypothetical protein